MPPHNGGHSQRGTCNYFRAFCPVPHGNNYAHLHADWWNLDNFNTRGSNYQQLNG
jgi:hypothetical protein